MSLPSVLRYIVVNPGIKLKAIESDALFAYWDFSKAWPYLGIKSITVHAEVGRCIP